jgi:hypothetical protein
MLVADKAHREQTWLGVPHPRSERSQALMVLSQPAGSEPCRDGGNTILEAEAAGAKAA